MVEKVLAIAQLMRWHRPVGITLLWFPTLCGLWIAAGDSNPPPHLVLVFTLGCVLMRSAGCVVNDIFDRNIDPHVARTKTRPLASGRLSVKTAWFIFAVLCLASASLLLYLNFFTQLLAVIGLLIATLYPLAKRITFFPQAVLGIAFSWGILMASTSVTNEISSSILTLFAASFFWVFAYDTIYAMMDEPDDSKIDVKSTAVKFRDHIRPLLGFLYGLAWLFLIALGFTAGFGLYYFSVASLVGVLFVLQIVKVKDATTFRLQRLFNSNQWLWLLILIGIVLE